MPDELTPSRKLDRAALDRVLARAAELQSSSIEGSETGGLSESEILELGKEAGMSVEHLRQAIAEERTRSAAPDDRGVAATIIGPATVRATRVVPGTPRELLESIDRLVFALENSQTPKAEIAALFRHYHTLKGSVNTIGLVTLGKLVHRLEDLLEELVGDIVSEHVPHVPQLIKRGPNGTAIVSGATSIRELNRALGVELPEDTGWTTLAGLSLALAGRMPVQGEVLQEPHVAPDDFLHDVLDVKALEVETALDLGAQGGVVEEREVGVEDGGFAVTEAFGGVFL